VKFTEYGQEETPLFLASQVSFKVALEETKEERWHVLLY